MRDAVDPSHPEVGVLQTVGTGARARILGDARPDGDGRLDLQRRRTVAQTLIGGRDFGAHVVRKGSLFDRASNLSAGRGDAGRVAGIESRDACPERLSAFELGDEALERPRRHDEAGRNAGAGPMQLAETGGFAPDARAVSVADVREPSQQLAAVLCSHA